MALTIANAPSIYTQEIIESWPIATISIFNYWYLSALA